MTEPPEPVAPALFSPDGRWHWDGASWQAVAESPPPAREPEASSVFVHCPGCGVSEKHTTGCATVQFSNPALTGTTARTTLTSSNSEAKDETCPSCQVTTRHRSYCQRANEPRGATVVQPSPQTATNMARPRAESAGCMDGHTLASAGGKSGTMYACSTCHEVRALPAWTNVRSVKASTPAGRAASKSLVGARPASKGGDKAGWFGVFVIGLVIYGLAHACGVTSLGSGESSAEARCENYIKTLLQAPATAHFSGESAKDNGDKTWDVSGNVDSQNGFGANLRSSWTCTARDNGNGWSIVSGNVDG